MYVRAPQLRTREAAQSTWSASSRLRIQRSETVWPFRRFQHGQVSCQRAVRNHWCVTCVEDTSSVVILLVRIAILHQKYQTLFRCRYIYFIPTDKRTKNDRYRLAIWMFWNNYVHLSSPLCCFDVLLCSTMLVHRCAFRGCAVSACARIGAVLFWLVLFLLVLFYRCFSDRAVLSCAVM